MVVWDYDNFIFDLYGTLIDISCDERKLSLWKQMSRFYSVYGSDHKAGKMRDLHFAMDKEERDLLIKERGMVSPEIRLEKVFARLLFECEHTHPADICIAGKPVDELRKRYTDDKEGVLDIVQKSEWVVAVSNLFRTCSRKYIGLFPGIREVLDGLKREGKKVYLLSNAQRIFTGPELELTDLMGSFDAVYISSDHYLKKPDPGFMEVLLKGEGLDPDRSVMIGNEEDSDVAVAKACNMNSILLKTAEFNKKDLLDLFFE